MAGTGGRVRCEATVGARERHDGRARMLEPFAKECWRDPQGVSRLRSGQLENLAEHVGQAVWPVQALEHAERAANFYFLSEERSVGVGGPVQRQAVSEILGEPFEGHV